MNNKILIVSANYYKEISKNLELGASNTLKENGYEYEIINAPGCFEIPYLIKKNIENFKGFISSIYYPLYKILVSYTNI